MKSILKKIVSVAFLLVLTFKVFAPASESLALIRTTPIEPFTSLIHAIGMVETQYDTLAFNPLEGAVGYFQIRPIRLNDYNFRTGSTYTCLLYTSDAADEEDSVDLGGRRIIKKKKKNKKK